MSPKKLESGLLLDVAHLPELGDVAGSDGKLAVTLLDLLDEPVLGLHPLLVAEALRHKLALLGQLVAVELILGPLLVSVDVQALFGLEQDVEVLGLYPLLCVDVEAPLELTLGPLLNSVLKSEVGVHWMDGPSHRA